MGCLMSFAERIDRKDLTDRPPPDPWETFDWLPMLPPGDPGGCDDDGWDRSDLDRLGINPNRSPPFDAVYLITCEYRPSSCVANPPSSSLPILDKFTSSNVSSSPIAVLLLCIIEC
jgi:hypothetical protein